MVTGEHSGIENPNMPAALADTGITTFAAGRLAPAAAVLARGGALGAPRYPSNIYYNASNWPDELNEYNTLYVAQGDSIGNRPRDRPLRGHLGHYLPSARPLPRPTCLPRSRTSC